MGRACSKGYGRLPPQRGGGRGKSSLLVRSPQSYLNPRDGIDEKEEGHSQGERAHHKFQKTANVRGRRSSLGRYLNCAKKGSSKSTQRAVRDTRGRKGKDLRNGGAPAGIRVTEI